MNARLEIMHGRRQLLRQSAASLCGLALGQSLGGDQALADDRPKLKLHHPRCRVPLSFIIDDSTCLVNMGHYCMPQFAEAWPERAIYKQPWKEWPREIPDSFVREFGEWCAEHGVKGKYSIVPYPACVGWLDRGLPGWSRTALKDSLKLVRELMLPNWDIHPEMITHTRVIDLKTGRPLEGASAATMENSYPQTDVSVDYLASYFAYALQILKNCGLPCEGITTPGGFGNRVKQKLPLAVHQAVRDVYGSELPHYFKYVVGDQESPFPRLEPTSAGEPSVDNVTVNIPAGTGDWFGGWEGTRTSEGHRYANDDATSGRMVDLIKRKQPAVMLCHWPGMYCNGTKTGFEEFKRVVLALHGRYQEQTQWMKLSEIGRYYAARELTKIRWTEDGFAFDAPLACKDFTFEIDQPLLGEMVLSHGNNRLRLKQEQSVAGLKGNSFVAKQRNLTICMSLPKGVSQLQFK